MSDAHNRGLSITRPKDALPGVAVTKSWSPPEAPEPREARRQALYKAQEAVATAHVALLRAGRLDTAVEYSRALAELTKAFKVIGDARETVRVLVEDLG